VPCALYGAHLPYGAPLLRRSIEEAERSTDVKERSNSLNSYFTYSL